VLRDLRLLLGRIDGYLESIAAQNREVIARNDALVKTNRKLADHVLRLIAKNGALLEAIGTASLTAAQRQAIAKLPEIGDDQQFDRNLTRYLQELGPR
jgi:microsomal dipeptidase-like Zn-dependent dipeptidase